MIVYIAEGILAIASIIYYALSRRPEWLILVGIVIVMMAVERLIAAVQDLVPDGDIISIDADTLEWISTDKALPPEPVGKDYLEYNVIIDHKPIATTLQYRGNGTWAELRGGVMYEVKYWRELPEIPEEVKNEQSNTFTG